MIEIKVGAAGLLAGAVFLAGMVMGIGDPSGPRTLLPEAVLLGQDSLVWPEPRAFAPGLPSGKPGGSAPAGSVPRGEGAGQVEEVARAHSRSEASPSPGDAAPETTVRPIAPGQARAAGPVGTTAPGTAEIPAPLATPLQPGTAAAEPTAGPAPTPGPAATTAVGSPAPAPAEQIVTKPVQSGNLADFPDDDDDDEDDGDNSGPGSANSGSGSGNSGSGSGNSGPGK